VFFIGAKLDLCKGRTCVEGFENKVVMRMFGSKEENVLGEWRQLCL
jgi:hypothetical protein